MGKYSRHKEFEVHLTTFDGAQHLRLHGWLKRNDVLVRSEGIQSQKSALFFVSFIILINNIMLEKLKEDNLDRGLYCDINVLNSENDRWDTFNKPENIFDKIQDFLFSFQLKDKKDIESFIEEANNTSLALFKKSETFINDYIETKEMSYKEKIKDLDTMIEAFVEDERYEDCAFLVKIKDKLKLYHIKQKLKTDE